jgi:hypothetical protein
VSFIAKINPEGLDPIRCSIALPSRIEIPAASELFIWTTESSGGHGLIARGISGATPAAENLLHLNSLMILPMGLYGIDELAPFRDIRDETLISFLAKEVYFYSHRRVIAVPDNFAANIRENFVSRFSL